MSSGERESASRRPPASVAARTLLVLFLCAGIAVLGLLAGGEHRSATARVGRDPMAGYYGPDMPRYPGAEELPAGPATRVGGSAVRMSYFSSEDEPAKVARFYASFWQERRLFVRHDVTHVGGVVSAVDPRGTIYQALITVQGNRTIVFPSVTHAPLRAMETGKEPPPVPLYPESKAVLSLTTSEGGAKARIHLSVNDGDLEANVAHYSGALRTAGYTPQASQQQPAAQSADQRILVYHKDGREVTVSLAALGKQRTRVHLTDVEAP